MKTKEPITEMKCVGFKKFNLKPFGRFTIMVDNKKYKSGKMLEFNTLSFDSRTTLKLLPEVQKKLIKMMKDNKTDILIDGYDFYTLMGVGITKVEHKKIKEFLNANCVQDFYWGTWKIVE